MAAQVTRSAAHRALEPTAGGSSPAVAIDFSPRGNSPRSKGLASSLEIRTQIEPRRWGPGIDGADRLARPASVARSMTRKRIGSK